MQISRLVLAGSLLLTPVLSAQGWPPPSFSDIDLKGTFPFNETLHIVQQAAVNGACGTSLSGPATTSLINDTGEWTFDGKGNMSITDSGVMIQTFPPTQASQVVAEAAQCRGTYHLLSKTTVDLHYNCSLDKFTSYFSVHTMGKITPFNILVTTVNNSDGTPGVTPYIYLNQTVGCSYVLENTVVSLSPNFFDWL